MAVNQQTDTLAGARRLTEAAKEIVEKAVGAVTWRKDGREGIDEHQVSAERIAQFATQARAAQELTSYAERQLSQTRDSLAEEQAFAFSAEVVHALSGACDIEPETFGNAQGTLEDAELRSHVRAGLDEARLRRIGRQVIQARGTQATELDDTAASLVRDSARSFAKAEVAPIAQEMHRQDHLVPEDLIKKIAGLGLFGASIPESYGGTEMGYLTMCVLTEELSAASLVVGSLITRSEILTRALLAGGTDEQRQYWLPRMASGEKLVGIAVTEPDVGSDSATVTCRATRGQLGAREGWFIEGAKAWSTFAGRADILALLARTDPDPTLRHRGLSLFIVEKEPFNGHSFVSAQAGGGSITGTANPTPGYRGMHSFTIALDRYFVPDECLVGGKDGLGRGFYLQMGGFEAGRLQTGGRATGVGQASLEKACQYALDRKQFGKSIAEFQLTEHKIGRMATHVAAGRHLTYAAARTMERDEADPSRRRSERPGQGTLAAAMCKLFASDVAVWVSQEAQLIHGGWGYSEEDPVARYVVDAQVLPIFEGVKPILELQLIARQLLA
jgi:(2S)-methylsuccinyl-CoA dehydrogenase